MDTSTVSNQQHLLQQLFLMIQIGPVHGAISVVYLPLCDTLLAERMTILTSHWVVEGLMG